MQKVPPLMLSLLLAVAVVPIIALAETTPAPASAPVAIAPNGATPGAAKETTLEFTHDVVTVITTDDQGGKLRMPQALFFDHTADELYLLNGDNRIVVYGPDYFPQESLGKDRGLDSPVGGVVDENGRLYIPQGPTPSHPPRLTILDAAFLPVKEIGLTAIPDIGNFYPQRIAIGKTGKIYLTGLESNRVLVLGPDGGFAGWFTIAIDTGGDYLAGNKSEKKAVIKNVVVDSLGDLFFLSEGTSKVYVFDAEEHYLFAFGTKGGAEGKLSRPRALAIDEAKRCFYVVDYMRHSVLIYDFTGTFRFEFGGRGWGPGWFNYPVDITIGRHGQVIVADFFNQRAQVFEVKLPLFPERAPSLWSVTAKDDK